MGYSDIQIDSSSDYVKLTAGEVVTIHILSRNPEKTVIHWVNKKKELCPGEGCENCETGNRPKARWLISVWDRKDKKVKKMEFGAMIATQLKGIAEMLSENSQTIHQVDIRIKTTGSDLTTEYSVLHVLMSGEIPQDIQDKFSSQIPF